MKYLQLFVILAITLFTNTLYASNDVDTDSVFNIVDKIMASPGIEIDQPESLTKRLEKDQNPGQKSGAQAALDKMNRHSEKNLKFKVEVYADNTRSARANAEIRRNVMQKKFPKYPAVLVFESPFWRVKVGNFNNRSDAEAAMSEIRNAIPSYGPYLRVVRN